MTAYIHHALHGYQEGHRLLASSLALSQSYWYSRLRDGMPENLKDITKALDCHTDISGYLPLGYMVESYEKGYPAGNVYVFSRTWYDNECSREGAAITHSLLIPQSFIEQGMIPDIYRLEAMFKRPPSRDVISGRESAWSHDLLAPYREMLPLELGLTLPDPTTPSAMEIAVNELPVLVSPPEAARELVRYVWQQFAPGEYSGGWQNASSLTFCTCALSPQRLNGELLKIQGVPRPSIGAFSRLPRPVQRAINLF